MYRAGSRHAVRIGARGAHVLHVTDPRDDWGRTPSPLAPGFLHQISVVLAAADAGDEAHVLHLESLVGELALSEPVRAGSIWLDAARRRLREGYAAKTRLTDLAVEAGVHRAHFARAFRRAHGMTAGEYLMRVRLAAAVTRLRRGRQPIAAIAAEISFADQSHLGRCIRRYLRSTPRSIRSGGR